MVSTANTLIMLEFVVRSVTTPGGVLCPENFTTLAETPSFSFCVPNKKVYLGGVLARLGATLASIFQTLTIVADSLLV